MNKTQKYYNKNYKSLIEQYNSIKTTPLNQLFNKYIKPKHKVLDIGFGSGRDLRYIHQSLKADCYGVDSCQGFIDDLGKDEYFRDKLFLAQLPNLNLDIGFRFDVIVLVAVLMHLRRDEIVKSIESIKKYLVDGGVVIISYSIAPREDDDRFFEDLRGGVIEEMFLNGGFRLVEEMESLDSLGREIGWRSGVYELFIPNI